MGSFSHGIADAIRRMGDAQAQGALQKGAVYGNLAHDLGQAPMQYLAIDRGLHENKYRQTMQAAQEKKLKDDQEFEALINSTPPGPERLKVSLEFWQGRDPEKYDKIVAGAYHASSQALAAQQGQEGKPKLTPDPISGEPTQIDDQTYLDPVEFPAVNGQPAFSVTPETRGQIQKRTSLQKYMDSLQQEAGRRAGGGGLDAAANRALTEREGVLNRQNRLDVAQLPKQDTSINPYEDFRSNDPTKRKNAEEFLNRSKDTEAAELRKVLLRLSIKGKQEELAGSNDADLQKAAEAIVAHRMAPSQLSVYGRSKVRSQIMAKVYELDPEFDAMQSEAGRTAGDKNQKLIRSIDAADAGLNTVLDKSKAFGRTDVGLLNNIILKGEVQVNNPKAIQFQTAINAVIDDVASVLSGGGATTDQARNQATKIFHDSYSQGGLDAAVGSLREVLTSRRAAFSEGTAYEKNRSGPATSAPAGGGAQFRYDPVSGKLIPVK